MKNEKNRVIIPEDEKLFPALNESEEQQEYETKEEEAESQELEESELLKEVIEAKEKAEKEITELQKNNDEQPDESIFKRLDLALYLTFYNRIEKIVEDWRFMLKARFERQSKGLLLLSEMAWTPQTSKSILGRAMNAGQIYTIIHKLPAEDIFKLAQYFHEQDNK